MRATGWGVKGRVARKHDLRVRNRQGTCWATRPATHSTNTFHRRRCRNRLDKLQPSPRLRTRSFHTSCRSRMGRRTRFRPLHRCRCRTLSCHNPRGNYLRFHLVRRSGCRRRMFRSLSSPLSQMPLPQVGAQSWLHVLGDSIRPHAPLPQLPTQSAGHVVALSPHGPVMHSPSPQPPQQSMTQFSVDSPPVQ